MKIVLEWFIAGAILLAVFYPYIGYYRENKTLKNSVYENGEGYLIIFTRLMRDRFVEVLGTLILLFLLCIWSVVIGLATVFYFVAVLAAGAYAQRNGASGA